MEGRLTIEECTDALIKMKLNKAPGIDGLSVEFYRTFWEELKEFIVSTFNSSLKKGINYFSKIRSYLSFPLKKISTLFRYL